MRDRKSIPGQRRLRALSSIGPEIAEMALATGTALAAFAALSLAALASLTALAADGSLGSRSPGAAQALASPNNPIVLPPTPVLEDLLKDALARAQPGQE